MTFVWFREICRGVGHIVMLIVDGAGNIGMVGLSEILSSGLEWNL